mgnify:CR=1 FL=1
MNKWVLFETDSFTDATCDTTSGSHTVSCDSSSSIKVGQKVVGPGIPRGSVVAQVNSAGSVTSFKLAKSRGTTLDKAESAVTNTNSTFRFFKEFTDNLHAYPEKNVNAIFITAHNTILIYARNPVQSTEAVSDDKITLVTRDNKASLVLEEIMKRMYNSTSITTIKCENTFHLESVTWAAGT